MFEDLDNDDLLSDGENVLDDLEGNLEAEPSLGGRSFRIEIKCRVTVYPGNASRMFDFKYDGITAELADSSLNALFSVPLQVGDIYRLHFDRNTVDLPTTFARCVHSRMILDDAFENGFEFFVPVEMPQNLSSSAHS